MATERRQLLVAGSVASGVATPATNTIGRTGKMHGEIPAINPAAKATTISVTIGFLYRVVGESASDP